MPRSMFNQAMNVCKMWTTKIDGSGVGNRMLLFVQTMLAKNISPFIVPFVTVRSKALIKSTRMIPARINTISTEMLRFLQGRHLVVKEL